MPFIGNKPSAVPLTSADITDNIIVNADINTSAGITTEKLSLISTASVASVTAKGTPSVSDGYIQLNCEQNSHGIKIKSPPHSAGANYTLVMPSATGTSLQSLRMNSGATALEFATVSGKLKQFVTISDNTEYATNTATTPTAVQSSAADLTITPSSASSRILVCYNWGAIHTSGSSCLGYGVIRFKVGAGSFGDVPPVGANVVAGSSNMHFKVTLESANYMARPITYGFIHHPNTTSAVVYRPFFWTEGGGGHTYINRSERDNANDASGVMFAYAIEIENN